ncbi:uncharacterized protein LOC128882650 isoform X2 [Hylaeus volcanicus]|uniref:uncharacterized protein LOC128882650 isoform X2 n=1 Tax=Hylaeus volcanicus TaxID=313075 RepID=UPI0023B863EB|nr:uncharacterized protein LOC128882650 isoform X2 [Hylaeus volcanicus]
MDYMVLNRIVLAFVFSKKKKKLTNSVKTDSWIPGINLVEQPSSNSGSSHLSHPFVNSLNLPLIEQQTPELSDSSFPSMLPDQPNTNALPQSFNSTIRSHDLLENNNKNVVFKNKDYDKPSSTLKNKIQFPTIYLKVPQQKTSHLNPSSIEVQTEQNREVDEPITLEKEILQIVSSMYTNIKVKESHIRVDALASHISVNSDTIDTKATITFSNEDCLCDIHNKETMGQYITLVTDWCTNLFRLILHSYPKLFNKDTKATVNLYLTTELHCYSLTLEDNPSQETIHNTDILWGRMQMFDNQLKNLPVKPYSLVTRWSRVGIIRSSPLDSAFRTYIAKTYFDGTAMKSLILETLQQACSVEELLKNRYLVVDGSVIIEWPFSFQLKKLFEIMLPSCLALYPRGTKLTFATITDTLQKHTMLCDANNTFVFV